MPTTLVLVDKCVLHEHSRRLARIKDLSRQKLFGLVSGIEIGRILSVLTEII